jgi:hypothetical protein
VARAIAPEAALAKKAPRKPAARITMAPTAGPNGPRERPACAQDADRGVERVRVGLIEISLSESDRLGEGSRANCDWQRGDHEQGDEILCQSEQSVSDGGTGERQQKRRHARSPVDPGAKRRAKPRPLNALAVRVTRNDGGLKLARSTRKSRSEGPEIGSARPAQMSTTTIAMKKDDRSAFVVKQASLSRRMTLKAALLEPNRATRED